MVRVRIHGSVFGQLCVVFVTMSLNVATNSSFRRPRARGFLPAHPYQAHMQEGVISHRTGEVESLVKTRSSGLGLGEPDDRDAIRMDGDILLGGLFPMHEAGSGGQACGAIKEHKGIQRVEAMLYAINKINEDPDLLRKYNLTVGVHILDTCLRDTYALEQSLEFIKDHISTIDITEYSCSDGQKPTSAPRKPVAGVVGAAASPVSIMVANILRLFEIPQISYASTGIELSDKTRFDFFSRVVPPDTFQAQAMVDIVKGFNWSYVSTVADEGNYGEKGIATFEGLAEREGICIAESLKIPREAKRDTFTRLISKLKLNTKAKVVVLFANEDNCRRLINASVVMGTTDYFYWLASDSWGSKTVPVRNQEWGAEGAVTILPMRNILQDFNRYFTSLTPSHQAINPWFTEFWEKRFNCSFHPDPLDKSRCTGHEKINDGHFSQEGIVPFVVDAVYAMVHAIHDLVRDHCDGKVTECAPLQYPDGKLLLRYIRNVTFTGAGGHIVRFNENGDGIGRYTLYQYQQLEPRRKYGYVPIGNWSDEGLHLDTTLLRWKEGSLSVPQSVCSEPCAAGLFKKTEGLDACCWVCMKCEAHEILVNDSVCVPCLNGTFPDDIKGHCDILPVQFMSLDSPWSIVPVVFAAVGVLCTLFVSLVFVRFNTTPVIMASGRELCYVSMAGLLMSYVMTFIMVSRPTLLSCTLMRVGLGLSLCVCYSALLTKTNRISRIFNRGVKAMVKRPSYTSPRSQIVICMCLVLVQMVGAVTWVGMDLPDTTLDFPDRRTVVLRCRCTNVAIVLSLLYNMILILMCTVYAFKTRKIPENFNEAKYIAFTMYSTCIVWLAFIPIYFGTSKSDFRVKITAMCMCVSISATVQLGCLYIPKVYIVLFQPHKNVRQGSKGAGGAGSGRPFFGHQSTRFSSLAAMTNGTVASPTGLALLIAQGPKKIPPPCAKDQNNSDHPIDDAGDEMPKIDDKCLSDLNSSDKDSDMETNV